MEQRGLIRIFCGEGRGKTSAAVGCAIRAASRGRQVAIIQFLKGKDTGENAFMKRLEPEIKVFSFEKSSESFKDLDEERRAEEVQNIMNGINFARKVLTTGGCDVLILDEFLGLVDTGIICVDELVSLLNNKPEQAEIILTGINAGPEIYELADDVTLFLTGDMNQSGRKKSI